MKKFFVLIVALFVAIFALTACQPTIRASESIHVDDNGASGTGCGSVNDPTPVTPLATDAETGEPIDGNPGEAFEFSDGCNPEDVPPIYTEPNDDTGPGPYWGDNYKNYKDYEDYRNHKDNELS